MIISSYSFNKILKSCAKPTNPLDILAHVYLMATMTIDVELGSPIWRLASVI